MEKSGSPQIDNYIDSNRNKRPKLTHTHNEIKTDYSIAGLTSDLYRNDEDDFETDNRGDGTAPERAPEARYYAVTAKVAAAFGYFQISVMTGREGEPAQTGDRRVQPLSCFQSIGCGPRPDHHGASEGSQ